MSYYNLEIYNYKNLKKEDKLIIDAMRWVRDNTIEGVRADIEDEFNDEDSKTIGKIKKEIAENVINRILERYESDEEETIVAIIDNYDD